jgi:hypothetical protein
MVKTKNLLFFGFQVTNVWLGLQFTNIQVISKWGGLQVKTSVGRFSIILENHQFWFFKVVCENRLGFYFLKKIGGIREPSLVSDFFQGKKYVLKLGVSQQFENTQFSGLVFTSLISKFSIFVFGKLYIYKIFFWQKNRLWIYFRQFMHSQFHLLQIVLTLLLGLHLSQ